jgi:xanthine dehydrogenase accessory factor
VDCVWRFIDDGLARDEPVTLMLVVEHEGSAPGKQGFVMAVSATGLRCGTVGGGVMEFDLVEQARVLAAAGGEARLLTRVHRERAAPEQRSGLICAGSQRLVLVRLDGTRRPAVQALLSARAGGRTGQLEISATGFSFVACDDAITTLEDGSSWRVRQRIGAVDTITIVGGGHVGVAIARAMATLDFRVVVWDHRDGVETFEHMTWADEKRIGPYARLAEAVVEGRHGYAAVVTTAMDSDVAALRALLPKRLRYLGLMGSKAKLHRIFETLRGEGFSDDQLARIQAPIGIEIGNRTPAEIGISVAAQIIAVRYGGKVTSR